MYVRVNTRIVKLVVVPSRHRVPKLSLLFPSSPPPRELPDQTRHTPDVVSLQAFRNSRILYPRHCYSILFSGFHTHRRIDELVVHELQSITMHPAPCLNHVPKLSLLFPSSPPPRELPDQTRHTPDVVSLQAFRNSRILYPRHCYSILFSGFHTHRRIDELVVHELQSITMHPAPCLNHELKIKSLR